MKLNNKTKFYIYLAFAILLLALLAWMAGSFDPLYESVFIRLGMNDTIASIVFLTLLLAGASVDIFLCWKIVKTNAFQEHEKRVILTRKYVRAQMGDQIHESSVLDMILMKLRENDYTVSIDSTIYPGRIVHIAFQSKVKNRWREQSACFFFVETEVIMPDDIEKAFALSVMHGRQMATRFHLMCRPGIIFCILIRSMPQEFIEKVQKMYDPNMPCIIVFFELSTGLVYYMNGKGKSKDRLSHIQSLVERHIVGVENQSV